MKREQGHYHYQIVVRDYQVHRFPLWFVGLLESDVPSQEVTHSSTETAFLQWVCRKSQTSWELFTHFELL